MDTWLHDLIAPALQADWHWAVAAAVCAGLIRGFSGFGAAMVFIPVVSALYGPTVALPVLTIVDTAATAPLLPPAFRRCHWREVLPLLAGCGLLLPVGVAILVHVDAVLLHTAIVAVVLAATAALATGWRYQKAPGAPACVAIGGLAGFLGGATGMSGPPVILFWLGGQSDAQRVRANIIALFALTTVFTIAAYWANGLFTPQVWSLGLVLLPIYAVAIWAGAQAFHRTGERTFRRAALAFIALIAVASLAL